ncbi:MAG TPA: hypothetical protein VE616_13515 [Candidatus Udaeobacter sp.]|nr:hypothetical protein [Candidatus Udaeobacter sp.]
MEYSLLNWLTAVPLLVTVNQRTPMTREPDYSRYTLRQLLEARHGFYSERYPQGERRVEEEIQKRCAYSQEATSRTWSSDTRYRPYGLIFGIAVLALSIGPALVFAFLDSMALINADDALLWILWALLTLPFAVIVFIMGGIMDAERIVKRLGL